MSKKSPDELCQDAQALVAKGQAADAIAVYQTVVAGEPDHVGAHEGLALAYSMISDWPAAEKHFAKLIQLQPMEARHYVNLGTMYNRKGDFGKAVDTLRRALQRDRKNANAYFNLGLAYRKLKQTAMSVNAYKEAIRLSPEFVEAYVNLANVLVEMKSLQQAVQMFKQALILRPHSDKIRKALEKAQAAIAEAKKSQSPFGRLVDAETRAKAVPTMERELSEEERELDRREIRGLMDGLDQLGRECLDHLQRVLERRLHELHVTITSDDVGTELNRNASDFRDAVARWNILRQQLRRKVLELRAHEELLTAPEVKLP
jgi:tetratricopeptide (TPR) repeat protein